MADVVAHGQWQERARSTIALSRRPAQAISARLSLEPFVLGFFHGNASGGPPGSSYTFSGVLFSIAVNTEMSALRSLSGRKCEGKNDGSNVPSK